MTVAVTSTTAKSILTRASGFLRTVCSHSLQPYRGCTFGKALCGVGCYVQHNTLLTRGAPWGSFLDARSNAAAVYARQFAAEQKWARSRRDRFCIFMSSSTDPFVPQEWKYRVTQSVIETMIDLPPDELIVQTHTHRVVEYVSLLQSLHQHTELRVHLSIESDRDRLPGLPPPASSVARRFAAAAQLRAAGLRVVITVSPLLPIADPSAFFKNVSQCADAVVVDHFIRGDGSADGIRTRRTPLPAAMVEVTAEADTLAYRDRIVACATQIMPGRVGVGPDGFAGRFLPA